VTAGGVVTKTPATDDADARFAEVTVEARSVDYALLPVVMPGQSAEITGIALAGLGSAICKLPPVMMCNPNETEDKEEFDTVRYVGSGIRLVGNVKDQNGNLEDADEVRGTYGPGVFGYLETNAGNGAIATAQTLGRVNPPGDCFSAEGADVKPGQQVSVLDALNTRFGIYGDGLNNVCDGNNALCPPSGNARIDLVQKAPVGSCGIKKNGFQVGPNPYRPSTNYEDDIDPTGIDPMGYPRDKCHAVDEEGKDCKGNGNIRVGNGDWDRNAYYETNGYGKLIPSAWSSYGYPELVGRSVPTRFQQYRFEYENSSTMLAEKTFGTKSNRFEQQGRPLCTPSTAIPPGSNPDRRVLSVAVINCAAERVGASTTNAKILKFIDVFLVEPTARRTHDGIKYTKNSDVYVEVIGTTKSAQGANQGQVIRKDTPYLLE
jgi:hypothetical protein